MPGILTFTIAGTNIQHIQVVEPKDAAALKDSVPLALANDQFQNVAFQHAFAESAAQHVEVTYIRSAKAVERVLADLLKKAVAPAYDLSVITNVGDWLSRPGFVTTDKRRAVTDVFKYLLKEHLLDKPVKIKLKPLEDVLAVKAHVSSHLEARNSDLYDRRLITVNGTTYPVCYSAPVPTLDAVGEPVTLFGLAYPSKDVAAAAFDVPVSLIDQWL